MNNQQTDSLSLRRVGGKSRCNFNVAEAQKTVVGVGYAKSVFGLVGDGIGAAGRDHQVIHAISIKIADKLRRTTQQRFMLLSRLNLRTARAWRIKEAATLLWDYRYLGVAEKRWKELLSWISRSKLEPMVKAGRMIRKYFWGILNAIRMKTSNAMLESVNSGIQKIKRMACGFRNRERFRMAILFHFGGLDMGF